MHQHFAVGNIICMEIGYFKVVRRFGRGKGFNLYRFYYSTTSVRKQDLIQIFQISCANPFSRSV